MLTAQGCGSVLASQTALPPLHRYIHAKKNGNSNQIAALNRLRDSRAEGSLLTGPLIRSRPTMAHDERSRSIAWKAQNAASAQATAAAVSSGSSTFTSTQLGPCSSGPCLVSTA